MQYPDPGSQLRTSWANGTGQKAEDDTHEAVRVASEPEPTDTNPRRLLPGGQTPFKAEDTVTAIFEVSAVSPTERSNRR